MDVVHLALPVNATAPMILTAALLLLALSTRAPRLAIGLATALLGWLLARGLIDGEGAGGIAAKVAAEVEVFLPVLLLTLGTLWVLWRARTERARSLTPSLAGPGWALAILGMWLIATWFLAPLWPGQASARPWFLAGLEALEGVIPAWYARVVLPLAVLLGLWLLPAVDEASYASRTNGLDGTSGREIVDIIVVLWVTLGLVPLWTGLLAGGSAAASGWPLSIHVWERWTGFGLPASAWVRELPGVLVYALYFVVLPYQLSRRASTRGVFGRYLDRLGPVRYFSIAFLLLLLLLPIVKAYALWLLGIGDIVHWSEGRWAL